MGKNKILTIVLVLLLVATVWVVVKLAGGKGGSLVSPGVKKTDSSLTTVTPAPTNNAPKEIRYGSNTNLKQELDAVNPQVLDSDFE